MAPAVDPKNELTDRERELMALAWLCFSEKPKVRIALGFSHLLTASKKRTTNATALTARLQETRRPRRHDQPGLRQQRLGRVGRALRVRLLPVAAWPDEPPF